MSGNHPLVVSEGNGKCRASIDDPLVLPKGQDNLWALPRKRGQGRASGDYLLNLQKEVSIPWPFPKGGDREGKVVTTPGEDQERDNPWALPKGKAKGGQTDNPWALPKEKAKRGHTEG